VATNTSTTRTLTSTTTTTLPPPPVRLVQLSGWLGGFQHGDFIRNFGETMGDFMGFHHVSWGFHGISWGKKCWISSSIWDFMHHF
jgi:hypothetical protein